MRSTVSALLLTLVAYSAFAQSSGANQVEFGMMTWPEVKRALHEQGKTTALIFNGGTEQRGPQNVNGGHTLIAEAVGVQIAEQLGNAILVPVLPFSVNRANGELPGTIGLSGPLFAQLNEEVAEQMIKNGFKSVVLMGDHGGGQKELREVAAKLDERHSSEGVRVVYCSDVYDKATKQFDEWLTSKGLTPSPHAGIDDTSEMLYLGGDKGWVRKNLIPTAVGDPIRKPGEPRDPSVKRVNNGITGDARQSTAEIGKHFVDYKVAAAVSQIRELLTSSAKAASASVESSR
jgi:creatinine amidohydrolase